MKFEIAQMHFLWGAQNWQVLILFLLVLFAFWFWNVITNGSGRLYIFLSGTGRYFVLSHSRMVLKITVPIRTQKNKLVYSLLLWEAIAEQKPFSRMADSLFRHQHFLYPIDCFCPLQWMWSYWIYFE